MQQDLQQGTIKEAQEAVLDGLPKRFGQCPSSSEKSLLSLESIATVNSLHRYVVRAESREDFQQFLQHGLE